MVLRGGSEQFIDEAERSLHDAIMIVRRAVKNASVVPGGGAIDMEISKYVSVTSTLHVCLLPCSSVQPWAHGRSTIGQMESLDAILRYEQ